MYQYPTHDGEGAPEQQVPTYRELIRVTEPVVNRLGGARADRRRP